ncbi:MAG: hypothetical protein ACREK6_15500 [Candidatus Rokuibacteriota bacterium]
MSGALWGVTMVHGGLRAGLSSGAFIIALALAMIATWALPGWAADDRKVKAATSQVDSGAKKIGQGVEQTAKGIGHTVVEGAKYSGKKVKEGATSFGQSVKAFFSRLF